MLCRLSFDVAGFNRQIAGSDRPTLERIFELLNGDLASPLLDIVITHDVVAGPAMGAHEVRVGFRQLFSGDDQKAGLSPATGTLEGDILVHARP